MISLDLVLALLEIGLLITAFWITTYKSVKGVIRAYRLQSFLLAAITGLTAIKRDLEGAEVTPILILLIVLLPLLLGISIEYFFVRATVIVPGRRIRLTPEERQTASHIWLKQQSKNQPLAAVFFVGMLAISTGIAFLAIPSTVEFKTPERIGLMVSLSLHLIGLYNTSTKGDIISQAVGLLTMDHGLYLAIVKIVGIPVPAAFFVFGLYFYTMITIAIVVFIVPQVRHGTQTIDLDVIAQSSKLEG